MQKTFLTCAKSYSKMMKLAAAFLCFSVLVCEAKPAMNRSKSDPVPLQPDFDVNRYVGKWYEVYRTTNIPFESGTDISATYSLNSDGSVGVLNREWLPNKNRWNSAEGRAVVPDPKEPARLSVKFFWLMPGGDYRVLHTDYENISLVYSDISYFFGLYRKKFAWILARKPELPEETVRKAFELFEERVQLKESAFLKTPHGQAPN